MRIDTEIQAKLSLLKIHFFYVTVILISIIILLASGSWTKITGFTDYLTSAGTMVSIVLGVLAIIYSFVSGDSISKSIGSVAAAAQELQAARDEFSNIVEAASELTEASKNSSSQLGKLVAEVGIEVQELKSASSELNHSTGEIVKTVRQLPERFDKLDSALEQSLKSRKPDHSGYGAGNEATLKTLVQFSSNYGRTVLYAASLSKETGRSIFLSKEPFKNAAEYCFGFLSAADAAYVLDYSMENFDMFEFKIVEFPLSSTEILQLMEPVMSESLKDLIVQVQIFFNSQDDGGDNENV